MHLMPFDAVRLQCWQSTRSADSLVSASGDVMQPFSAGMEDD